MQIDAEYRIVDSEDSLAHVTGTSVALPAGTRRGEVHMASQRNVGRDGDGYTTRICFAFLLHSSRSIDRNLAKKYRFLTREARLRAVMQGDLDEVTLDETIDNSHHTDIKTAE